MVKHRQLVSQGFSAPYAAKLAKGHISASRLALARCAITLRPSYPADGHLGAFWWAVRGVSTVFTTLKADLRPTHSFMRAPPSYRGDDSFLLAEALTLWTAQTYLDVDVLLSIERHPHLVSKTAVGASPPKALPKGYRPPRTNTGRKSAPDFIGIGAKFHVLESKGRANFGPLGVTAATMTAARNKALHQVCQVDKVDGHTPATRTACVFSFEPTVVAGLIVDPPSTERVDLRLETAQLLRNYYGVFLDPMFEPTGRDRDGFVGLEFAPDWRLSIDREVYYAVRALERGGSADELLGILRRRRAEFIDRGQREDGPSVGPDGIRLDGPADFELPPLRKRWRG